MRMLSLGGALLLAAAVSADEVDLRTTRPGRVSLKVSASPLSEVLDRLARQTGMKVIYDGAPPRTIVRYRQVDDVTTAEAVSNVLEGLGVAYALRLDASGAGVDTLMILAASKSASGASAAARPAVPPVRMPGLAALPTPADDEPDEDVPSERSEESAVEMRPGTPGERPEIVRPPTGALPGVAAPAPGQMGIPGVPAPVLPTSPIGPLAFPAPGAAPSPSPPPQ